MVKLTPPLPAATPGGPVTAIHEAFETADHGHVSTVDTEKLPEPAAEENVREPGLSV